MIEIKRDCLYGEQELRQKFDFGPGALDWETVKRVYDVREVITGSGIYGGANIVERLCYSQSAREEDEAEEAKWKAIADAKEAEKNAPTLVSLESLREQAAKIAEQMRELEAAEIPAIGPETGTATQEAAKNGKKGRGNG